MTVANKQRLVNHINSINYEQKMKKLIQTRRDYLLEEINCELTINKQLMDEFIE